MFAQPENYELDTLIKNKVFGEQAKEGLKAKEQESVFLIILLFIAGMNYGVEFLKFIPVSN
jgi:hypothetical protein